MMTGIQASPFWLRLIEPLSNTLTSSSVIVFTKLVVKVFWWLYWIPSIHWTRLVTGGKFVVRQFIDPSFTSSIDLGGWRWLGKWLKVYEYLKIICIVQLISEMLTNCILESPNIELWYFLLAPANVWLPLTKTLNLSFRCWYRTQPKPRTDASIWRIKGLVKSGSANKGRFVKWWSKVLSALWCFFFKTRVSLDDLSGWWCLRRLYKSEAMLENGYCDI